MTEQNPDARQSSGASRRAVLRLGAIAVPAVVTLKPAFAAATSVMNCQIPMNDWVDAYGNPTTAGAENAFAPPSRPYLGEEIRTMTVPSMRLADGSPMTEQAFNAHVEYIKKLQGGTAGFTCFASIAARGRMA